MRQNMTRRATPRGLAAGWLPAPMPGADARAKAVKLVFSHHLPSAQLFGLRTSAEALQLGALGNWQPHYGFVAQPFLFSGFDQVKRVLSGTVGEQARPT